MFCQDLHDKQLSCNQVRKPLLCRVAGKTLLHASAGGCVAVVGSECDVVAGQEKPGEAPRHKTAFEVSAALPQVYGHRCFGGTIPRDSVGMIPENSMPALQAAIDANADGVEIDVWLTADNQLLVIHGDDDGDVRDTTTAQEKVNVEKMTLNELSKKGALNLKETWFNLFGDGKKTDKDKESYLACRQASPLNCKVPLLEDILKMAHGKLKVNVELKGTKPELGPMVVDLAWKYPGTVSVISSFNWQFNEGERTDRKDIMKTIVDNSAGIPLSLLIDGVDLEKFGIEAIKNSVKKYGAQYVAINFDFAKRKQSPMTLGSFVKELKAENVKVVAWWKVDKNVTTDIEEWKDADVVIVDDVVMGNGVFRSS